MPLTFTYDEWMPRRTVAEEDIAAAEHDLGVALPQDFRAFLLEHDGPAVSPAWFPAAGPNGTIWCGPLFAILSSARPYGRGVDIRACSLEPVTTGCRKDQHLPPRYVVIAQMESFPNLLLLSTDRADMGAVYAWRAGQKKFRPDQTAGVAGSFTEFLGLLSEPPAEAHAAYDRATDDRRAGRGPRPPAGEYEGPEARRWLRWNLHPAPLASNRFGWKRAARVFVDDLYALGATRVLVPWSSIQGRRPLAYADALVVSLPSDPSAREEVCRRCERETSPPGTIDASDPNPVFLWWD